MSKYKAPEHLEEYCSISGCKKVVRARSWCSTHYARWQRHGDPLESRGRFTTPEESFAARAEWQGDCLIWTGARTSDGYGQIWSNGKAIYTHRFAWEQVNGPIPEGMFLDHEFHCNPACCNIEHLRLATNPQNTANRSGPDIRNMASGVRNVERSGRKWRVVVMKNKVKYRFGSYSTIAEAAEVAEQARLELFGEFAGRGTQMAMSTKEAPRG